MVGMVGLEGDEGFLGVADNREPQMLAEARVGPGEVEIFHRKGPGGLGRGAGRVPEEFFQVCKMNG